MPYCSDRLKSGYLARHNQSRVIRSCVGCLSSQATWAWSLQEAGGYPLDHHRQTVSGPFHERMCQKFMTLYSMYTRAEFSELAMAVIPGQLSRHERAEISIVADGILHNVPLLRGPLIPCPMDSNHPALGRPLPRLLAAASRCVQPDIPAPTQPQHAVVEGNTSSTAGMFVTKLSRNVESTR